MVMAGTEPAVSPMRGKSGARSDLEELTSSLRVALAGAWNLWPTKQNTLQIGRIRTQIEEAQEGKRRRVTGT